MVARADWHAHPRKYGVVPKRVARADAAIPLKQPRAVEFALFGCFMTTCAGAGLHAPGDQSFGNSRPISR